jgi:LCP family protein required for cell wall assembly
MLVGDMNRRSSAIAALLSFLWPGAGHYYLGRRRTAAVFAIPLLVATVVLAARVLLGVEGFAFYAISPAGALTLFLLIVISGMWRLIAMADAVLVTRRDLGPFDGPTSGLTAFLVAVMFLTHGGLGWIAYSGWDASYHIFTADTNQPAPSDAAPSGSDPIEEPSDSPPPSQSAPPIRDGRLTVLLIGVDSAPGRSEALTDTLMLVSILPSTGELAMVSLPRDISRFPLYNGGIFTAKVNSLMSYASSQPKRFPDGGLQTLANEVGFLVGVPVDYYASVNLGGFRTLIDTVGGVTVNNPRPIIDPRYEWLDGTFGLTMPAGVQTLNGRLALAFARSRLGVGDSDFTRANRQQILLLALRDKLTSPDMLPKIPTLLQVAGQTIRTNIPADLVGELVGLAKTVDKTKVQQIVLGPPYAVHPNSSLTGGTYILQFDPVQLAKVSIQLFGTDSRYSPR